MGDIQTRVFACTQVQMPSDPIYPARTAYLLPEKRTYSSNIPKLDCRTSLDPQIAFLIKTITEKPSFSRHSP